MRVSKIGSTRIWMCLIALIGLDVWSLVLPAHASTHKCFGRIATIVGTGDDDVLVGTKGDDVIVGLGGYDVISGRRGRDLICSGSGEGVYYSSPQNSTVKRGSGDRPRVVQLLCHTGCPLPEEARGGRGNDRLDGGAGADRLFGGPGQDHLLGGPGGRLRLR